MSTPDRHADAVVVGGGLHGCSAALFLAQRGLSVILLEKDQVGRHASGLNAGGVRRLGRALPEIPLSVAAAAIWLNIEDLVEDDCGFQPCGQVKVAETEPELSELTARAKKLSKLGFRHEKLVDREVLQELLPAAAAHCPGGLYVEDDGYANPLQTVEAFQRRAMALGVQFHEHAQVTNINQENGTWRVEAAGHVYQTGVLINCAGAWGGDIAAMLGETAPIRATALMLTQTAPMPAFVKPVVGAQGRRLSLKQLADGSVLIGGGHEGHADPARNETRLDDEELAINEESAAAIFPIMQKANIARKWAGIEGMMPDGLPVIGPGAADGVFHAFGFSAHGFQLGPICGKILSDLVVDGTTELPITPFRIDRPFSAQDAGTGPDITETRVQH